MGGKNKPQTKSRTKGNVKPSSSEKAANFLVNRSASLTGTPFSPFSNTEYIDSTTSAFSSFSGGKLGCFVPLDNDPDAVNIDSDIRMQLKKLDKRDSITKQKALNDLILLLQNKEDKSDEAVLTALPYWPRIYSRLALDEDRKVRELAQRSHACFAERIGKNLAPYLKLLLPSWIMSQCDLFEPAALEAERSFLSTFPANKQKNAYLHCWSDILNQIEESLRSEKPPPKPNSTDESNQAETSESKYARSIVSCLRTISKLLPFLNDNEEAVDKLNNLFREKFFWSHSKSDISVINAAYYHLISQACRSLPALAQTNCVQFCEITLRHVDEDSPTTVAALWEALLSVLNNVEEVWRFVSFKKSFYPKLGKVLEEGGYGCGRHIYSSMLPLFSKLPLSVACEEDAKLLYQLMEKMNKGLHKDRVLASSMDSNSIALAIFECSRFLIQQSIENECTDFVFDITNNIIFPILLECLTVPRCKSFSDSVFTQLCQLINYSHKHSSQLNACIKERLKSCISQHSDSGYFNSSLVNLLILFCSTSVALKSRKHVSFSNIDDLMSSVNTETNSSSLEEWKTTWLQQFHIILGELIAQGRPECLMPYFFITQQLPMCNNGDTDRTDDQLIILELSSNLLTETNLSSKQVCCTIGHGLAKILGNVDDPGVQIAKLFSSLSESEAVLFLGKIFPWLTEFATSMEVRNKIVSTLEVEIIKWSELLINQVFNQCSEEFEDRFRTLFKIIFKLPFDNSQSSLLRLKESIVNNIVQCFSLQETLPTSNERLFLSDNLQFVLSFQNYDSLESWLPLCQKLWNLYLQYIIFDMKVNQEPLLPTEDSDDSILLFWSNIQATILTTYSYIISNEEKYDTEGEDFLEEIWTSVIKMSMHCRKKRNLDKLSGIVMEFAGTAFEQRKESFKCIILCVFNNIDLSFVKVLYRAKNNLQFRIRTHHKDISALKELLNVLYSFLPVITRREFDIPSYFPDYWIYYIFIVCFLESALRFESNDCVECFDDLRGLVMQGFYFTDSKSLIDLLMKLCLNDFSVLGHRRIANEEFIDCYRSALLFICPHQEHQLPPSILQYIDCIFEEWDSCDEYRYRLITDVAVPIGIYSRLIKKEMAVASIKSKTDSLTSSMETINRLTSLMRSIVETDSSYLFSLLPILMDLKDNNDILVESIDDLDDMCDRKVDTTLDIVWILYKGVQSCPADVSDEQMDFILCLAVSLISVVSEDCLQRIDKDNSSKFCCFCHHVFSLVSALGTALPRVNSEKLLAEWNTFFSSHIYQLTTPLFIKYVNELSVKSISNEYGSSQTMFLESFSSMISVTPKDRLVDNNITAKLFADDAVMLPVKLHSLINTIFPLLYSCRQAVQIAAFKLLTTIAPDLAELLQNDDDSEIEEYKVPLIILKNLQALPPDIISSVKSANWNGVSPLVKDAGNHFVITGYLLTWRIVLQLFQHSSIENKAQFASWLLNENESFNLLMEFLFNIVPTNPIISLKTNSLSAKHSRTTVNSTNLTEESPEIFDELTDQRSVMQLQHLACFILRCILQYAPAVGRQWWLRQAKTVAASCERYIERFISPHLCRIQIEEVNKIAVETAGQENTITIKGRPATREVLAVYELVDSNTIEMIVALPSNYPLGQVSVDTGRKVGVSTQQWRAWLLQLTMFLQNQNGTILEGLKLWKRNLDKKFEGADDCMICYSILHGTTFNLPKMCCRVCKKRFHYACMYKWFTTSQNPTCPLCRNLFYDIPHAWRKIQRNIDTDDYQQPNT